MELTGKVALVTGSTSGIGLQIAHTLAEHGCAIVVTGLEEVQPAAVQQLNTLYGVTVDYIGADLLKKDQLENLVTFVVDRYPVGVDILINNAGFNHVGHVEEYPDEKWDTMVGVHMSAPFHLIKRLLPAMKKKGWGRIVNMSSQMAVVSIPGKAVDSAVKSGLVGLTKGVALEVAEYGVTCNAVCPTYARTSLFNEQMDRKAKENGTTFKEALADTMSDVPTGKPVTVKQIADLVLFLVSSEASSQMTGAHYLLDGGFTAH